MAYNPAATRFDDHPGHDLECPLKMEVHPHQSGSSQRGYRCYATDGHCVSDERCQKRIAANSNTELDADY